MCCVFIKNSSVHRNKVFIKIIINDIFIMGNQKHLYESSFSLAKVNLQRQDRRTIPDSKQLRRMQLTTMSSLCHVKYV